MKLLSNLCPQCRHGEIFQGLVTMNKTCGVCGLVFEREEGYFTGAMFLNYMFLSISAIPTMLVFVYLGHIVAGGAMAIFQIVLFAPFSFRFSRLLWINLDAVTLDKKF